MIDAHGKVSILTPCYNSAKFIHRLLDSVLEQTYPNIEMVVINDGSTDQSEEVILSYIPHFEKKGYTLRRINQPNQGQGSAINNGLKLIAGDYLVWPDSDDYYASPLAIEKMVNVLEKNEDYAMVRSFSNVLNEVSLIKIGEFGGEKFITKRKTDLFEDCLFLKNNFWFGAGNYMLRISQLFDNYPDKNIYASTKHGGQNWQLLLPMLYKNKCYTIEENLYNILARTESHSRETFKTVTDQIKKFEEHKNIIIQTLISIKEMPEPDREQYINQIHTKYELIIIGLLCSIEKDEAKSRFYLLRKKYGKYIELKNYLRIFYHIFFNR